MSNTELNGLIISKESVRFFWSHIKKCLENAQFCSIDLELSGIGKRLSGFSERNLEIRYNALKTLVDTRAILSIGLSFFRYNEKKKKLKCEVFEFILLPTFDFVVETDAMNFLGRHGFDFNREFAEGIPYDRYSSERPVKKEKNEKLKNKKKIKRLKRTEEMRGKCRYSSNSRLLERVIEKVLNWQVEEKIDGNKENNEMPILPVPMNEIMKHILIILFKREIPLIFHNGLIDLLFLFSHFFFHRTPNTLDEFNEKCGRIFNSSPNRYVIDTKYLNEFIIRKYSSTYLLHIYLRCMVEEHFKNDNFRLVNRLKFNDEENDKLPLNNYQFKFPFHPIEKVELKQFHHFFYEIEGNREKLKELKSQFCDIYKCHGHCPKEQKKLCQHLHSTKLFIIEEICRSYQNQIHSMTSDNYDTSQIGN
ncbi:hypothetical protein SNEBB_004256 [Seison nebaliae]|nr:hypothetical protein SNEBB_004256 [Seison nebaliae]